MPQVSSFHVTFQRIFVPVPRDTVRYRIVSHSFGYVHHYGIYKKVDRLAFSHIHPAAQFRFTNQNALQETKTGKCVNHRPGKLLVLTSNCDVDRWTYDSNNRHLKVVASNGSGPLCFSPWGSNGPPRDISVHPGLSRCSNWNKIILEKGGFWGKKILRLSTSYTPHCSMKYYIKNNNERDK